MQNKGAISVFAILLALVSIYYLSFTFVTNGVRSDAEEYAQKSSSKIKTDAASLAKGDKQREAYIVDSTIRSKQSRYLDSISTTTVYSFLFVKDYTYKECMERELNLGLDLKGGMNVTLEVSVMDLLKALSNYSNDPLFLKSLDRAKEMQKSSQEDFLTLFGKAWKEIAPNAKLASVFNTLDLKDRINFNTSNDEVIKILTKETNDAIDNSFNILRSRIDKFGVVQPNIQKLEGNTGRILIELPGVKEPERVRKLLQGTANLEFWETYENREVFEFIRSANDKMAQILTAKEGSTDTTKIDSLSKDSTLLKDNSLLTQTDSAKNKSLLEGTDSLTKQKQEIDDAKKKNPLFSVMVPSVDDKNQLVEGAAIGTSHYKDTAATMKILTDKRLRDIFPRDLHFAWTVKAIDKAGSFYQLIALKSARDGKASLAGDVVTNAVADFGENQANAVVNMNMNTEGANKWAKLTKQNINRQVAIVLDNYVYSYPVVRSEIRGGRSEISGNFTISEAKDLANILKSGKMPAPARIIQEEIVGPSLGQESIDASMMSFIIAFALVLLYMILFYNGAGVVANIALIVNVFFIFGILASFNAVLTLPGLAGIVLTLGMAVDANVLIYERVLEEIRAGKGLKLAVSDGFRNAMSAIIDSQVTTLLTGVILLIFGTGPIYGFAVTLIIGILTSLFTAIFIARMIISGMLDRNKNVTFTSKMFANTLVNTNVDFIGMRKKFYIGSGIIIVAGLISIFAQGWNLGVDFSGGRSYVVRFDKPVKTNEIRSALAIEFQGISPEVKTFGGDNQVKITTKYLIDSTGTQIENKIENKLYNALKGQYSNPIDFAGFSTSDQTRGILNSQKVGPTIADDIWKSAIYSIIAALLMISLYIFIRFRNMRFAAGALASLAHDVLFVLGIYSLLYKIMPFSLEIDAAFIGSLLTIVGYSINDTVVVFDRIREYVGLGKKWDRKETYNRAMNSTLRRTLNTSLTTLLTIFAIFIFGGEVVRGFIFSLLIGIGVGTYSSIFVATSVLYDADLVADKRQAEKLSKTEVKTNQVRN